MRGRGFSLFAPNELGKIVLLNREESTSALPDPSPPPHACERHPDWQPTRRGPQPRHVTGLCPFCDEEATANQTGPPVYIGGGLPESALSPQRKAQLRRLDEAYEAHLAASNTVRPGSREEEEALWRIDELREEDQRRHRRAGRIVAFRKFENGAYVEYHDVRRSIRERRRPLVRVAP